MSRTLPERASLDWLRKTAKQSLAVLKAKRPDARLADAQLALAREYGFPSWRALKAHVEKPAGPTSDDVAAALLLAIGEGRADKVRAALAAAPGLVNVVGPHPYWGGRPQPLHVAIETKRRDIFDLLLEAGANVNGVNDAYDDWSPLMLAINQDRPDMRDDLLSRGARVGLAEALLMKDDARVEALLRPGASALPTSGPNRGSILAFARTPYAIDRLLEVGADPLVRDRWGASPIEAMSRAGAEGRDLVRRMMMRGIVPEPQEFARLGDRESLAVIIGARPGTARSEAVMLAAVDFGHHDLVRWLIEQGGDPNARATADSRHTALHSAAWNGDLEMVKLLVAAGADIHARDAQYGGTPEGWAETSVTVSNTAACAEVAAWLAEQGG